MVAKVHTQSRFRIGLALFASILSPAIANAQMAVDAATGTLISTFTEGCVAYAGNPAGLAAWTVNQNLAVVPETDAQPFMGQNTGRAWNVGALGSARILIYESDGTCHVIAQSADALAAQEALITALEANGVSVTTPPSTTSPDGMVTTRLFEAEIGKRTWQLAIISKIQDTDPNGPPTVDLIAQDTTGK